jgi:hypothetical protein
MSISVHVWLACGLAAQEPLAVLSIAQDEPGRGDGVHESVSPASGAQEEAAGESSLQAPAGMLSLLQVELGRESGNHAGCAVAS